MQRNFLVVLLILSLFHGLWHEERELLLCRVDHGEQALSESTFSGEMFGNLPSIRDFASLFTSNRQQLNLIATQKWDPLQRPPAKFSAPAPGQNRRVFDTIHPEEWGLTVLRLPRSDG